MKALFLALLLLPALAWASCSDVKDPDQRAYCRAMETRSAAACASIRSYDLRQTCQVRLGSTPAICNTIRDSWERQKCREAGK